MCSGFLIVNDLIVNSIISDKKWASIKNAHLYFPQLIRLNQCFVENFYSLRR